MDKPDLPEKPDSDLDVSEPEAGYDYAAESRDEARRAFIVKQFADPDYEIGVLLKSMSGIEHWLKTGTLPAEATAPAKKTGHLKVVE